MAIYRQCVCCKKRFLLRPQNPNQTYCSKKACQKARKAAWQKQKLKEDADYRENQERAQKVWRHKNPTYYQDWRAKHPKYCAQNRALQKFRNCKKRKTRPLLPIAKMDASMPKNLLQSGVYQICQFDCKDGRVNGENLIKIKLLEALSG